MLTIPPTAFEILEAQRQARRLQLQGRPRDRSSLVLTARAGGSTIAPHESQSAEIRAHGGHSAPGLFDRPVSDGREPRVRRSFSGSSREERGIFPLDGLIVSKSLAKTVRVGPVSKSSPIATFAAVDAGLRGARQDLDQREILRLYGELFDARARPFDRGLSRTASWSAVSTACQPRRRLLRREHVPSRARRLEGRARPSGRAAAARRLPPARHAVRHAASGEPRRDRDLARASTVQRLAPGARRSRPNFAAWPTARPMRGGEALATCAR